MVMGEDCLSEFDKSFGVEGRILRADVGIFVEEALVPFLAFLLETPGLEVVNDSNDIAYSFFFRTANDFKFH